MKTAADENISERRVKVEPNKMSAVLNHPTVSWLPEGITPYYVTPNGRSAIYHGDLRELLPIMPKADLMLADPTYNQTALWWDKWVKGWPSIAALAVKPQGSLWCYGNFRMFWDHKEEFNGWRLVQDVIWKKHNGSGFQKDRFRRVHEQPVHFVLKKARWREVYKNPQMVKGAAQKKTVRRKQGGEHTGLRGAYTYQTEKGGDLYMTTVMDFRSMHHKAENPTQKPVGLNDILLSYSCPPGGLVIEPFMGHASGLRAAQDAGLLGIGIDLQEEECDKAARRLSQTLSFV